MDAAVTRGDSVAVLAHLRSGADPTAALLTACRMQRDAGIAEALARGGAVVNAPGFMWGYAPLHWSAIGDLGACCRVLLSAGAAVGAVSDAGRTPLHVAAMHGAIDCATQLVAAGADIRALDGSGQTPVDVAAGYGRQALESLLRDAAAATARWSGIRRAALTAWCGHWERSA